MRSEISITARGFKTDCCTLKMVFFGHISMEGTAGKNYRNISGKILKKSFVRYEMEFISEQSIKSCVFEILEKWGGAEHIKKMKEKYGIEKIHLEIHAGSKDKINSIFIDRETNEKIIMCCDSFGVSWN